MICYYHEGKKMNGRNIYSLIHYLKTKYVDQDVKVLCFFHNLDYDSQFILREHLVIINHLIFEGRVMSLTVKVGNVTIQFNDSYKLIMRSIKELPSMFGDKTIHKEIFPYNYYT